MENYPLWLSIGLFVYYLIFQGFSNFIKAGIKTENKSRILAELRDKNKVNIRTFNRNSNHIAFSWFNSIWINENILNRKRELLFAFHHEHYHVINKHKQKALLIRFSISLMPLALYCVNWWMFLIVLVNVLYGAKKILDYFEIKADEHAYFMIEDAK